MMLPTNERPDSTLVDAAIDYATTADGRCVLWEANPFFYMPFKKDFLLAKARRFDERRARAHRALFAFLRGLCS